MNESEIYISAVLPVHNEEGNIPELHRRLTATLQGIGKPFEIIYVENRSTDGTVAKLKALTGAKILIMRLPLEAGRTTQSIALDAGIKAAQGKLLVTLDSDLQNPPEEIPKLIAKLEDGNLDVVSGWRRHRKDKKSISLLSKFGSWLRRKVINPGVHDLGCTLKVYRREALVGLDVYGEMHRYIVAILKWRGYAVGEMEVLHEARKNGKSSYNWRKAFRGFVDMWQVWFWRKYADRPLHFFGVWGMFITLMGVGMLGILGILRIAGLISLSTSIWPLIAALLILTGTQVFISGITIDILVRNYYATSREPVYTFKEVVEV